MKTNQAHFVTDERGKKLSVIVPINAYAKMQEQIEELEDIKLYDAVKARKEERMELNEYLKQRKSKKNGKV
ncbi:MAG TPA: hypothetical protein VE978_28450 [Chitinophagales bacterium]|nr:hypothetical protein [Chitinophagales bacterium]